MTQELKPTPANGVTGYLLCSEPGGFFFRVYDGKGGFKDYDIRHSDLQVTINDPDAFLYPPRSGSMMDGALDHSPSTLGIAE